MSQRKPSSWFASKLSGLNTRLKGLTHFKEKAENEKNAVILASIETEIKATKTAIDRTRIESNFAELE